MRQKYGQSVYILITQKSDPAYFPNGAWFDEYVNRPMLIAGVDEDTRPGLYILPNGNSVPFSCAELISWTLPVVRSTELTTIVAEIFHKKRYCGQRETLRLLRLAFSEIPDNAELIISQSSPFLFADGFVLWLVEHCYHVDDYQVEFVAGVREVGMSKFCVVALECGGGSCISVTKTAHR